MGPDSFVSRGGVCETSALAQPRYSNNSPPVMVGLDPVQAAPGKAVEQ